MKRCILILSCFAMLLCSCGKDNAKGDGTEICIYPQNWTWSSLVKAYPFLSAFPEFHGDVENPQYRDLSGLETVTFFDYKCDESVATTYYATLASSGFAHNDDSTIYRKRDNGMLYTFTGGYSGGNFALSFSADKE